jgi:hypothetical protein
MTLKAYLFGEDKGLSKSFKDAGKAAEKSGTDVGKAAQTIKGHLGNLTKGLHGDFSGIKTELLSGISAIGPWGAAAGAAVGVVGAEFAALVHVGHESIDTFKDVAGQTLTLQRIMGGSAEDVSRLRFAFQETGVDGEAAAKGIGILSKNLVNLGPKTKTITHHVQEATGEWRKHTSIIKDAQGHFKKVETMIPVTKMKSWTESVKIANPTLHALGINARDAAGHIRPMADLLPEIADKFAKMPNGAEKSALALKLFGKGGLALLPFLNKGAAGIEELKKKSDEFGFTLSGKDLDALKKSRLAHKDWDAAIEGAKVRIGAQLLPMLTKLVLYFQTRLIPIIVTAGQWIQKHGNQIQATAGVVLKAIGIMIAGFARWATNVFNTVMAIAKVIGWLWTAAIKPTITLMLHGFSLVATAVGAFLMALSHVPGFGWAKDAALQLQALAKQANDAADALNRIPANKTVTINSYYKTHGSPPPGSGKGYASGGTSIPAGWAMVGERGPEYMYVPGGSTILPHGRTPGGAGGGSDQTLVVNLNLDGSRVQQSLLKLKHSRGGSLGLA